MKSGGIRSYATAFGLPAGRKSFSPAAPPEGLHPPRALGGGGRWVGISTAAVTHPAGTGSPLPVRVSSRERRLLDARQEKRRCCRNSCGNNWVCSKLWGSTSLHPRRRQGTGRAALEPAAPASAAVRRLGAALAGAARRAEPLRRSCRYFKNEEGAGAVATRRRGCPQRSTSRFLSAARAAVPGISDAQLALKLLYGKGWWFDFP